jgi:hypothetical protein
MKRPTLLALALAAGTVAAARPAAARIMDLHLSGDVGGLTGWGTTPGTPDFFEHTRGPAVGFDLGFKLLVFDLDARFTQVLSHSGTVGTLTQFMLGFVIDIPVGTATIGGDWDAPPPPPPPPPPQQPQQPAAWGEGSSSTPQQQPPPQPPPPPPPRGKPAQVVRPGIAAGFGFGTPGPVTPPLNDSQISDKGVVTEVRLEYEYFLSSFIAVGAKGLVGYHYFLGGAAVNASQGHSTGYSVAGFGTLTFHIGF